eukprot:TRINITY_DN30136_c0_g1_i1.p1 TRINITY_DN30136_c0_g1~~TRINITY_DN30136_c0_g1_i1.p1  ORF type:complete len:1155 (+),score=458.36 TRINITY_DN30136_c0_g1_i1:114-3578(+)
MRVAIEVPCARGLGDDEACLVVSLLRDDGYVVASDRATSAGARAGGLYRGALEDLADEMEMLKFEVFTDGNRSQGHVVVDFDSLEQHNDKTVTLPLQRGTAASDPAVALEVRWSIPQEYFDELEEFEEIIEEEDEEEPFRFTDDVPVTSPSRPETPTRGGDDDEENAEEDLNMSHLPLDKFMSSAQDRVTVMKVCSKMLVVGTLAGYVHVLDFSGEHIHVFKPGADGEYINDLDVDDDGNYVAACSRGGLVMIGSVCGDPDASHVFKQTYDQPIQAIALDPKYGSGSPRFIVGGMKDQITLVDGKGFSWFRKKWATTLLYKNTGRIYAIKWRDNLVAYADESSVKVLDIEKRVKVVSISVKSEVAPHPLKLYRCVLAWESPTTLLICWANFLAICEIRERPAYEMLKDDGGSDKKGYVKTFTVPYFVCGAAPHEHENEKRLLLLTYPDDFTKRPEGEKAPKPEMRILERRYGATNLLSDVLEVSKRKALDMRKYDAMVPSDYQLAWDELDPEVGNVYFVSPEEIMIGRQCNAAERVLWLLGKKKYDKAVKEVMTQAQREGGYAGISVETRESVLQALFADELYERAAGLLPAYLGDDLARWRYWVKMFNDRYQLAYIVDFVPVERERNLGHAVYELVLQYHLSDARPDHPTHGPKAFYLCIKEWPHDLYQPESIIQVATQRLQQYRQPCADPPSSEGVETMAFPQAKEALAGVSDDPYSMVALGLAMLYERLGNSEKALGLQLEIGRSDVFEFIERHGLYKVMIPHVVKLLWKNPELTKEMLRKHHEVIRPEEVVEKLRDRPRYLLEYLDDLYRNGVQAVRAFHENLVDLYAKYEPSRLYSFALRESERGGFDLEKFDDVCEARLQQDAPPTPPEVRKDIYRARAFVLGLRGNRTEALKLLIEHVRDVKEAVEFIARHDDYALFETLVQECFAGGGEFVGLLLDLMGDHTDPKRPIDLGGDLGGGQRRKQTIIDLLSPDMEIDGLRQKIARMLSQKQMKQFLHDGQVRVMGRDVQQKQLAHVRKANRGMRIRVDGTSCCACDNETRLRQNHPQGLVAFVCGHTFHQTCFLAAHQRGAGRVREEITPPALPNPEVRYVRSDMKKPRRVAHAPVRSGEYYAGAKLQDLPPTCPFCDLKRNASSARGRMNRVSSPPR